MRGVIGIALLAFTIYCVVDVVRSESSQLRSLSKPLWVILVLLFPLIGGVAWLLAGRPSRSQGPGNGGRRPPIRPPVVGPDDDPDFLRTIDRPAPVTPAEPIKDQDEPAEPREKADEREDPSERDDRRQ